MPAPRKLRAKNYWRQVRGGYLLMGLLFIVPWQVTGDYTWGVVGLFLGPWVLLALSYSLIFVLDVIEFVQWRRKRGRA